MRILLDMDECLVDFVGGACTAWGTTRAAVERYWKLGVWDMVPPLAMCLNPWAGNWISQNQFWKRLNDTPNFWVNLKPLPWADDLDRLVAEYTDDWYVVTAPSLDPESYANKARWVKARYGREFDRFVPTPHKHLLARPDVVLIDDRDSNVETFVAAGGAGIVFPAYHNSQHLFRADPLRYVRTALTTLVGSPALR